MPYSNLETGPYRSCFILVLIKNLTTANIPVNLGHMPVTIEHSYIVNLLMFSHRSVALDI
jgi:hypothetical protein